MRQLITVLSIVLVSCGTIKSQKKMNLEENKGGNYSVIMLNIKNEKEYELYRNKSEGILRKAGGKIEREFDVMGQKGNIPDFEAPNRIVVIHWESSNGHQNYIDSPEYTGAKEFLESSTTNVRVVKGTSEMFQSSTSNEKGRMYLIKISYYKKDTKGRTDMLEDLGPKLIPYGFYTERMIMVNDAVGISKPNELTIHFHDFASQNAELQKDDSITSAIGEYNQKFLTHFVYLPLKLRD